MPLSIGVFTYSTRPRGSVVCAAALAEALVELGHHAVLYALDKDRGGFYRELGCELRMMPAGPAPDHPEALIRQRVAEVKDYVRRRSPRHDVLHAQDCLVASGLLHAGPPVPLVRTVHHLDDFASQFLRACQARSIHRADACVSVSWSTQQSVRDAFGLTTPVIENGVAPARFADQAPDLTQKFRARHAIPDTAPLLLSVGGVEPRKNSLNMLRAFADFASVHPDARWLVVGGASIWDHSEYTRDFRSCLASLPEAVQRNVHLFGVLSEAELDAAYRAADVLLHAASLEGWGLCILEAMASGTSVVVSRGLPFEEYLDPICATFVEATSVASISRGLGRAYHRRNTVAGPAVARARCFSWARTAARHIEIYERVLGIGAPLARAPLRARDQVLN
ncbi:MAG TPA: MSMEG_0565 family glycosyltransferase [Polyangiaceae bacterium]